MREVTMFTDYEWWHPAIVAGNGRLACEAIVADVRKHHLHEGEELVSDEPHLTMVRTDSPFVFKYTWLVKIADATTHAEAMHQRELREQVRQTWGDGAIHP